MTPETCPESNPKSGFADPLASPCTEPLPTTADCSPDSNRSQSKQCVDAKTCRWDSYGKMWRWDDSEDNSTSRCRNTLAALASNTATNTRTQHAINRFYSAFIPCSTPQWARHAQKCPTCGRVIRPSLKYRKHAPFGTKNAAYQAASREAVLRPTLHTIPHRRTIPVTRALSGTQLPLQV